MTKTFNPQLREIPSYVKDTSDFLPKLNTVEFVPDNSYLVSLKVKSLYTSIPNAESIKGCTKVSQQPSKVNNGNKGNHNIISPHPNVE